MKDTIKKKLAIIGTVGLPANYGGFETLAERLVENLASQYDMTVYCTTHNVPKEKRIKKYKRASLKYIPFKANGAQSIPYDTLSILHALFFADVLLILGVSGAWILPFVKLFTNKKIIISIDGIEWKRNKWSLPAKWYLWWAEKIAVKYSHFDISDNESIQDYTAMKYGSLSNVIEYGADHTLEVEPTQKDIEKYPFLTRPYAFKVCRIEPENHVHLILEVFARYPNKPFVMVGNWKNSQYGEKLKIEYNQYEHIHLLDPIYDQRGLDLLRGNASLYVHGHSAGGTNPSLVEAMYLGLPIVSYGVSYNRTTTEGKAKYFKNAKELEQVLTSTDSTDWFEIGKTMKNIAMRRYIWSVIADKYNHLIMQTFEVGYKSSVRPITTYLDYGDLKNVQAAHLANQNLFFEN